MKQNKQNKKIFIVVGVTIITISIIISTSAFAATGNSGRMFRNNNNKHNISENKVPRIMGVVLDINGSIITISNKSQSTKYTIDASSAKIKKIITQTDGSNNLTSEVLVSDIKVGDTLMVQGVVNGESIAAENIIDGKIIRSEHNKENKIPRIIGTVSNIDGATITITRNNGFVKTNSTLTTYTVDASKAILNKFTPVNTGLKPTPTLILISDIKIGDTLIIQGTINGSNINATTITDGKLSQGRLHK